MEKVLIPLAMGLWSMFCYIVGGLLFQHTNVDPVTDVECREGFVQVLVESNDGTTKWYPTEATCKED